MNKRIGNSCILQSNDANNILCNVSITKITKDKAGIGGLLHLHRFASLLPTPSPLFSILRFSIKKQRQIW